MTNTCRQVIKMIAEKNKKSFLISPLAKTCIIIMIIGVVIGIRGCLEREFIYVIICTIVYIPSVVYGSRCQKNIDDPIIQRDIKEDITVGLQRLHLKDRTSIEQLEKEIEQCRIKQEKTFRGLTKGCSAILSVGTNLLLGGKFFESIITNQNFILALVLIFCIIVVIIGCYIIIYSLCQIIKAIRAQYNKYEITYTWLEEIKYTVK